MIDGPFAETKELVAGFWLWQVKSMDEAVEWVKRCPNPMPASEIEIRQVFEAEDFGAALTPEMLSRKSGCGRRQRGGEGSGQFNLMPRKRSRLPGTRRTRPLSPLAGRGLG